MHKFSRIFFLVLAAAGLVVSILSGTNLCNFGGCTEAHQYRLFGLPLPGTGIAFFIASGLLLFGERRFPAADLLFSILVAAAAGSEVHLILLQKNVIRAWCPLCLGIAAIVYLLTAGQLARHFTSCKEKSIMSFKCIYKPLMMGIAGILGFFLTFSGMAKPEASAGQLNLYLGKQDSKLEVYVFSDWLCPMCVKVEGAIESQYPLLSHKAKILFVDKILHPEAANFVPYHLSFEAYEKQKYIQLRKALFKVAQKTHNPTYEDIRTAIAPLKVTYKQLSFLEVTQQMATFQKLAEQFKVTATPTMVFRNIKTGKTKSLIGSMEIVPEKIASTVKELE